MAQPDRQALADGLVRIGDDAVAKSNDGLLDAYFTDDYVLHSPAGEFNRDQIKAYFAALRVMAGRFDNDFAYTPVGNVTATGKQVRWELHNIFRYTDDGRLAEEWVQTDTVEFLRQLGAPGF